MLLCYSSSPTSHFATIFNEPSSTKALSLQASNMPPHTAKAATHPRPMPTLNQAPSAGVLHRWNSPLRFKQNLSFDADKRRLAGASKRKR